MCSQAMDEFSANDGQGRVDQSIVRLGIYDTQSPTSAANLQATDILGPSFRLGRRHLLVRRYHAAMVCLQVLDAAWSN